MQIDAQSAQQQAVLLTPTNGHGLALEQGRQLVARVIDVDANGSARISLAGQAINVQSSIQLQPGDSLQLTVGASASGSVQFSMTSRVPVAAAAVAAGERAQVAPGVATQAAPELLAGASVVRELARAGVSVTPQLARSIADVVTRITAGDAAQVDGAARAVANLVGRGLDVSAAAVGRVASALEQAGQFGARLNELARLSPVVANALPTSSPSGDAVRALMHSGLNHAETAIARIVQATVSAAGAPTTQAAVASTVPRATSAAVILNYVASQVASATQLDELAMTTSTQSGTTPMTPANANGAVAVRGEAAQLIAARSGVAGAQAALGGANAGVRAAAFAAAEAVSATHGDLLAHPATASSAHAGGLTAAQQSAARGQASSAVGAASMPTSEPIARAVAELATSAIRFAPIIGSGESSIGATAQLAGKGINAVEGERLQLAVGARSAHGGATNQAPLVTAIREALLAGAGTLRDQQMLRQVSGATVAQLTHALQSLSDEQSLQFAGRMLELTRAAAPQLDHAQAAAMRNGAHAALNDLGRALMSDAAVDGNLRSALAHVASHDPRTAVADQATRLMHALDGQQVLSHARTGADPGYVWFQIPLPDQRSAEVLVRRDAARRRVTFEEFDIAFLLDTKHLGTMLIHLDAHQHGVRADIKTDRPDLEHVLQEHADGLIEPLRTQANRPVVVTTGVFSDDEAAPSSLLEPSLGLIPGVNEFYA